MNGDNTGTTSNNDPSLVPVHSGQNHGTEDPHVDRLFPSTTDLATPGRTVASNNNNNNSICTATNETTTSNGQEGGANNHDDATRAATDPETTTTTDLDMCLVDGDNIYEGSSSSHDDAVVEDSTRSSNIASTVARESLGAESKEDASLSIGSRPDRETITTIQQGRKKDDENNNNNNVDVVDDDSGDSDGDKNNSESKQRDNNETIVDNNIPSCCEPPIMDPVRVVEEMVPNKESAINMKPFKEESLLLTTNTKTTNLADRSSTLVAESSGIAVTTTDNNGTQAPSIIHARQDDNNNNNTKIMTEATNAGEINAATNTSTDMNHIISSHKGTFINNDTGDTAESLPDKNNIDKESSTAIGERATAVAAANKNSKEEDGKDMASELYVEQAPMAKNTSDMLSSSAKNSTSRFLADSPVNNEQDKQETNNIHTKPATILEDISLAAGATTASSHEDARLIQTNAKDDDDDRVRGAHPSKESNDAPTILAETLERNPVNTATQKNDTVKNHDAGAPVAASKTAMGEGSISSTLNNNSKFHAESAPAAKAAEITTNGNDVDNTGADKEAEGTIDAKMTLPTSPAAVDKSESNTTNAMPIDASDKDSTTEVEGSAKKIIAPADDTSLPAAPEGESIKQADLTFASEAQSPNNEGATADDTVVQPSKAPTSTAAVTAKVIPRGPWARATIFTKTAVAIGKHLLEEVNSVCGLTAAVSNVNDNKGSGGSGGSGSSVVGGSASGPNTENVEDGTNRSTKAMDVEYEKSVALQGDGKWADALERGSIKDSSSKINTQKEIVDEDDGVIRCPLCGTKNMTSHLDICPIMSSSLILKSVSPSPSPNPFVGDKQEKRKRDESFGLQLKTKVVSRRKRRRLYG